MKTRATYKLVHLLVACLLLFCMNSKGEMTVAAQSGTVQATATASDSTPEIGAQITVAVNIDMSGVSAPDNNLGSYTAQLQWNPSVLSYVSHTDAPPTGFTGVVNTDNNGTGVVNFNGANAAGSTGNILLITVTFNVIAGGNVGLNLSFSAMAAATTFQSLLGILTVNQASVIVEGGSTGVVELDGAVSTNNVETGSSISISHTTGSGDSRLILVGVSWNAGDSAKTITSVTFTYGTSEEVVLSEVYTETATATGTTSGPRYSAIWGSVDDETGALLNVPLNTAGTLTIAFSPQVTNGIVAGVANFKGVDPTDPLGTPNGANTTNTVATVSVDLVTTGTELVFDNVWGGGASAPTLTVNTSQTQLWNIGAPGSSGSSTGGASTKQAAVGTTTMNWTRGDDGYMALAAVPINPAAGEPPVCYALTLTSGANGTVPTAVPAQTTGCGPGYYAAGQLINLTAHPATGYQVATWSGTNNDTLKTLTNQLNMPAGTRTVNVTYELAPVEMIVEIDGNVSSGTANETTSMSIAHTTGTGENRLMLVGVSWNCEMTNKDIVSVEFAYGTTELVLEEVITQVVDVTGGSVDGPRYSAIYASTDEGALVQPPQGTSGTLTITFSPAVEHGIVAGVVNFKGVDPLDPLGTPAGANGETTDPSVTLTGLGGTELIFDNVFLGGQDDTYTLTVGANQTQHWNTFQTNTRGTASTEQATGSSMTMSWDAATENWWAQTAVPINPAEIAVETFDLTMAVSPTAGGTTSPSVGVHTYNEGTIVNIVADPASGYAFVNWTGDVANASSASTTVTMDADKTVTANFTAESYTLTINITGSGTVEKSPDQATYNYGTSVALTATPADVTWNFAGWEGDLSGTDNPETIVMNSDKTVTARFTQGGGPLLPSSYYGEVHFEADDDGPQSGDSIEAYIDSQTVPIAYAALELYGTPGILVYTINVPGYSDGSHPSAVTFKIDGRIVAIANWITGTNTELNNHPPKADAGGPYLELVSTGSASLIGTTSDWGEDVDAYNWDLDEDGAFDDAAVLTPTFAFASVGTYPVSLKVLDEQGGEGVETSQVFAITLSGITGQVYNGSTHPVTVTGVEAPYTYSVLYGDPGSSTPPTNAGTYDVLVQVLSGTDVIATYETEIVIAKAPATVNLTNLSHTYDGTAKQATASTDPSGLGVTMTYDGSETAPVNAGTYAVVASVVDVNYEGSASGNLTIAKAIAEVTLSNLEQLYDGSPKPVTVVTVPTGLTVTVTYDGSTTVPSEVGSYPVIATVNDTNYQGSASDTLNITGMNHVIDLVPGWNLVSFNIIPASTAVGDVLESIDGDYGLVYAWDASVSTSQWLRYDPSVAYGNTLTDLDETMGFWIYMNQAATLTVIGTQPTTTTIDLSLTAGGWNLIGYPSLLSPDLPDALSGIAGDFTLVYSHHAADTADPWKVFDVDAPAWSNDLEAMDPGWGYWIFVTSDTQLIILYE